MGNPESGPSSDPPTMIGRYAVKRELGRGGMGVVYLAHDAELERDVAIKTLPGVDESNPDRLRRFEREAKVLAAINHPNIATIYSIDKTDDGLRFIVLEYVEGETLGRLLKKSAVTMRQSMDLCIQMAKAIAAAHAKGIVHRDIKPGNVMITPDMTVKVLDFGLSMRESTGSMDIDVTRTVQTMPGQVMGTPGYMSPEQARGKPVDKRADIWSFGCIVFQTLTGHPAFHGETSTDIIASTLHNDPDWSMLPVNTPRNMRDLLQKMLAKKPEDRLEDMSLAIEVLTASQHRFSTSGSTSAAQYGHFEAVKELHSGSHASIWEVRPLSSDGGEKAEETSPRYVAKIVEPPSVNLAPDQTMRLLDSFRAATSLQKRIADDPESRHWAKIHEHGQFPGGAFAIIDYVEYTAADLITINSQLAARELYAIANGTVQALRELDRMLQRPHGNLKPTNILLQKAGGSDSDAGAQKQWSVLLTDPASDAQLESDGKRSEDDLRELGKLLYRLVEREEWRGRSGSEIPLTGAWKQLGRSGAQWHALCNDLLSDDPPSLPDVAARLENLAPRRGVLPMKPLAAAACIAVLAIGGWLAFSMLPIDREQVAVNGETAPSPTEPPTDVDPPPAVTPPPTDPAEEAIEPEVTARDEYEAIMANWLRELIGEPPALPFETLAEFGADDELRRSIRNLRRLDPEQLPGGHAEALPLVYELRDQILDLFVDRARTQQTLWSGVAQWHAAANELRAAAAELRSLLEASEPVATDETFADRMRLIAKAVDSEILDDDWDRLMTRAEQLASELRQRGLEDDPVLHRLEESIRLEFSAAGISEIEQYMDEWAETLSQIEAAMERIPDVDISYMRQNSATYEGAGNPEGLRRSRYLAWSEAVVSGRWDTPRDDPRDDEQVIAALDEKWQRLRELREQFHPDACPEVTEPTDRGTETGRRRLEEIEWDQSHATQKRIHDQIAALRSALRREIDDWNQAVVACQLGCEEELRILVERDLPVDALPQAARPLLEPVLERWEVVRKDDSLACEQRRDIARHISQFVQRAGDHLFEPASAPAELPAAVDASRVETVFRQKWDELVESKLRQMRDADWSVGIAGDDELWADIAVAESTYQQWHREARDLLAHYRDVERRLELAFGWEDVRERYEVGGEPWSAQPIYAELSGKLDALARITRDIERLREIEARQVETSGDAQQTLQDIAREEESPAFRWAAWRRMADAAAQRDFLDWEEQAAPHIETMLSGIERVRQRTLETVWRNGRRERWLTNAAAADSSRWLRNAFERMDDFGITDPAGDIADARLRFNLDLIELRKHVARYLAADEPGEAERLELQRTASELAGRVDELAAAESDRRAWRDLLAEIAGFEFDTDEQRGPDWSEIGPARIGWTWELGDTPAGEDAPEIVRYRPPEAWLAEHGELLRSALGSDPALTFRRVSVNEDGDEPRASYLSTTEVPAGLFIALARATGAEGVLRSDLLGDDTDTAHVWTWRGEQLDLAGDLWLDTQRRIDNDMPPPAANFPMQHVTGAAAIGMARTMGCRLPTHAEWRGALEAVAASRGEIEANFLDPTLEAFIERVRQHNSDRPMDRLRVPGWASKTAVLRQELTGLADQDGEDPLFDRLQLVDRGWLMPVETGSGDFQHLVGNVAEFIFLNEFDFEALAELPPPTEQPGDFVDRLRTLIAPDGRDGEVYLRIVGGSIFTEPQRHPIFQPMLYARSRQVQTHLNQTSYSDVGFRLAFDSSAEVSPDRQFAQLLDQALDEQAREPFLLAQR